MTDSAGVSPQFLRPDATGRPQCNLSVIRTPEGVLATTSGRPVVIPKVI